MTCCRTDFDGNVVHARDGRTVHEQRFASAPSGRGCAGRRLLFVHLAHRGRVARARTSSSCHVQLGMLYARAVGSRTSVLPRWKPVLSLASCRMRV